MTPQDLGLLSDLLDQGQTLPPEERETWLATLEGEALRLLPTLRELLARQASAETGDLLQRLPSFDPPDDSWPASGEVVGPYRLLSELGVGGMGTVWLAERQDGTLKRKVALKLPHLSWTAGLAERFAREREILSSLEHPHIARLYDAGLDQRGRPYMALEYVDGQPIDAYCRERHLGIEARLRLLLQVAEAVAFAHRRLVVHRDLKPANILVTTDGQARLLDFGIAKLMEGDRTRETALTRASGRALTLDYASPEQIRGEPIGTASDVYSLGVVAFEVLVGARPYRLKRGSAAELEEAILLAEAPLGSDAAELPAVRKQLRGDLDAILNKALKKRAEERYATVDALAQDWRRYLAGERVHARPDTLAYRAARLTRRYRVPLAAAAVSVLVFGLALGVGATAVIILALLLGLGASLWQAWRAREQALLARQEAKLAAAAQAFVLDLFRANSVRQKDPLKAQQTTARELLDLGAERIGEALRDVPESRIEVLGTLADMYYEMGLQGEAAVLKREATALAREVFGRLDPRYAKVAVDCAGKLSETAYRGEIPSLLEAADAALVASGQSHSAERAELLFRLAQVFRYESLDELLARSEAAVPVIARVEALDVQLLIDSLRMAGRARIETGELDRAETHYREAVRIAGTLEDARDSASSLAKAELCEVVYKLGRLDEAVAIGRESVEHSMRAHGPGHRWTMIVQIRHANTLLRTGDVAGGDALRASVVRALSEERPDYDVQFRADMGANVARTVAERGRPDLAEAPLRADLGDLTTYFPHSSGVALRKAELADIASALGRHDEALALADEALAQWERYAGVSARRTRRDGFALVAARVLLAAGRPRDAHARLVDLDLSATVAEGRAEWLRAGGFTEPARIALALDEPERALRLAEAGLEDVRRHLGVGRALHVEARALLVIGQARLRVGTAQAAEQALREAVALRRRYDLDASLWLGEALLALAGCVAAQGRTTEAEALIEEARRGHACATPIAPHPATAAG